METRIADHKDAALIANLTADLLEEINQRTGTKHFQVDHRKMTEQAAALLGHRLHAFLLGEGAGMLAMGESAALYAGGIFGAITELYVQPEHRGQGHGQRLLMTAAAWSIKRGWSRLEVTVPPQPEYAATLAFYQKQGFKITSGPKMKRLL